MDIWADFNSLDQDGRVLAILPIQKAGMVVEKDTVLVRDVEGNQAKGVVESLDGPLMRIRVDYDTWVDGAPGWPGGG